MNPAAALATKCAQTSQRNSWYLSTESLVFVSLNVFGFVGVYGTYWQLTLGKNQTSRLAFIEKRVIFTETFASVFHRKEVNSFYWIETCVSVACWLTNRIHGHNPVSFFLHGTASTEREVFNLKIVMVVTVKYLPHSWPFKSSSAWHLTPVYINRISGEGGWAPFCLL